MWQLIFILFSPNRFRNGKQTQMIVLQCWVKENLTANGGTVGQQMEMTKIEFFLIKFVRRKPKSKHI